MLKAQNLYACNLCPEQKVPPFISAAEMINKFHAGTRELDLYRNGSILHVKTPKTKRTKFRLRSQALIKVHNIHALPHITYRLPPKLMCFQ